MGVVGGSGDWYVYECSGEVVMWGFRGGWGRGDEC